MRASRSCWPATLAAPTAPAAPTARTTVAIAVTCSAQFGMLAPILDDDNHQRFRVLIANCTRALGLLRPPSSGTRCVRRRRAGNDRQRTDLARARAAAVPPPHTRPVRVGTGCGTGNPTAGGSGRG